MESGQGATEAMDKVLCSWLPCHSLVHEGLLLDSGQWENLCKLFLQDYQLAVPDAASLKPFHLKCFSPYRVCKTPEST
jgi:hypothetical protein